jgi:predicted phosphohydrolase
VPQIAWLTDLHLNFVKDKSQVQSFLASVAAGEPDAVLIGGDIAPAKHLVKFLSFIDQVLQRPVYFVLGNHDYYYSSTKKVRGAVAQLCEQRTNLHYLTQTSEVIALGRRTALVGHDGWADARAGDYDDSQMINDYLCIADLVNLEPAKRKARLQELGDEAATHVGEVLPGALRRYEHVLVLTHVPPFPECCFHKGKLLDAKWTPHYCCQALGEAVVAAAARRPRHRVTVLAGHLHSEGQYNPAANVSVLVAGAEYGHPAVARVFHLPD